MKLIAGQHVFIKDKKGERKRFTGDVKTRTALPSMGALIINTAAHCNFLLRPNRSRRPSADDGYAVEGSSTVHAGIGEVVPFRTAISGESLLRYEADGMVIFTADQDPRFLGRAQHWIVDGTFRVVPADMCGCRVYMHITKTCSTHVFMLYYLVRVRNCTINCMAKCSTLFPPTPFQP